MGGSTTVWAWSPANQEVYAVTVDTEELDRFKRAIHDWLNTTHASRPQPPAGLPRHIRIDHLVGDPEDAAVVDVMMRWAARREGRG